MTGSIFMEQAGEVHLQSWHRDRFFTKRKDVSAQSRYLNEANT
ncbi:MULTISPECIES: hypothetical protein [Mesobacillus]|nr:MULTISPECIES: hypothetical protein [Mesobacillus]